MGAEITRQLPRAIRRRVWWNPRVRLASAGPSGARTQGGRIAALFGRLRTPPRAVSAAARRARGFRRALLRSRRLRDLAQGRIVGAAAARVELALYLPDRYPAFAQNRAQCLFPPQPAGLGRVDRVARVEEVEERGGDEVIEVGLVDGSAEGSAVGDRVEGAVGTVCAEVAHPVGEVGAVEAVAGEAGGGPDEADPSVLDPSRPAISAVEVHAWNALLGRAVVGETVLQVVALDRVADRDEAEEQPCSGSGEGSGAGAARSQVQQQGGHQYDQHGEEEGEDAGLVVEWVLGAVGDEEDEDKGAD